MPVERGGGGAGAPDAGAAGMVGGPSLEDLSPEERAQAEEMIARMADVQRQILATPVAQLVANHVVGFYELAAIHLGQPEPDLAAAKLAIDAMASVLDVAESRLGEDGLALRQALTQLQIAFVNLSDGSGAPAPGEGGAPTDQG